MTDIPFHLRPGTVGEVVARGLAKRRRADRRFRLYGALSIGAALLVLAVLIGSIANKALPAFTQAELALDVDLKAESIDPQASGDAQIIAGADYLLLIKEALRARFPEVTGRSEKRELSGLLSAGAAREVRDFVLEYPESIGTTQRIWVLADDEAAQYLIGAVNVDLPEEQRRFSDLQISWIESLRADDAIRLGFNRSFFTSGDSREPELAGVLGAIVGSILTLLVTLGLSFPLGVCAAVYLEVFAPKNRLTDLIEVNINNLAAVPSIIFGLLGLAIFLNFFGLPRSAPLVGGLVLSLMTLPTIIIAARASLKAVPPSIWEAALGMGASRLQALFHHILPLALPGMMTGTIIGMAQALGETAPLLMIGMVAFIVDVPQGFTDPGTVLPVQIYLWADSPERAFVALTSAAILVLLSFLIMMNALAVILRKRFERRW